MIWAKAKENIEKSKVKSTERENRKIVRQKTEEFKVGDKVMVEREVFKGRFNRTENPWDGPFVVAGVNDINIIIKKRNRTTTINRGRCKPYTEPGIPKN